MKWITGLALGLLLTAACSVSSAASPYVDGRFQGRIDYVQLTYRRARSLGATFHSSTVVKEECPCAPVHLIRDAIDESAGGVPCYEIITPTAFSKETTSSCVGAA